MNHLLRRAALFTAIALPAWCGSISFLNTPATAVDSVNWSSIGPDSTSFSNATQVTSMSGNAVTIGLGTQPDLGGLTSVVCPSINPANCSWDHQPAGYNDGDTLIWLEGLDSNSNPVGTGPLTLTFGTGVSGAGTYLQSVSTGPFSGSLSVYNGDTLLGSQTFTSDTSGDPLFFGAQDSVAGEINRAVLTVNSCGGFSCDPNDFSIDTLQIYAAATAAPEPATFALCGGLLALALVLGARSKRTRSAAACITVFAACAMTARAQDEPVIDPSQLTIKTAPPEGLSSLHGTGSASASPAGLAGPALPLWQYSVVSARDGNTYQGAIVGGNPFNRGARTTTVQVVLIPIRIALTGTVRNFDPTSPDSSCIVAPAMTLTQQSPLFTAVPNYTINGVNMGNATIPDAFQRAEFWSSVSSVAPAYHLGLSVTVKPVQTITTANNAAGSGASFTFNSSVECGTNSTSADNPPRYAAMDINFIDTQLNTIITNLGLTANQFPLFLMYRTFMTSGPPGTLSGNCCILGYHSTTTNAPANAPGQTYGIAAYYPSKSPFQPGTVDISALSHEFMEWVNDPSGVNLTPAWGGLGQVGGCQNNFETGDPLSGKLEQAITMPNGVTYHPQEQGFFSWYFGGASTSAGGKYSSNGTFGGFAKACPPGGTN
jgi:hypothetical protein